MFTVKVTVHCTQCTATVERDVPLQSCLIQNGYVVNLPYSAEVPDGWRRFQPGPNEHELVCPAHPELKSWADYEVGSR